MLLSANNIHKSYRNDKGEISRSVLLGLDLDVNAGEKIAIVGPSGSGKTTLLNLMGTLDLPDQGDVLFNDESIVHFDHKQRAAYRNQEVGFIFQLHHLLPQCTALENVLVPALVVKNSRTEHEKRAKELLKLLGLWEIRDQKPGELSGGECQRVAVIRALINQPSLLLADEPTGALDEHNADNLMQLLIDLNDRFNTTLIVVTHAMDIARKMDKIYQLREGILVKGN
jgi:ABC-type lipoprotein export system ATPase subunit